MTDWPTRGRPGRAAARRAVATTTGKLETVTDAVTPDAVLYGRDIVTFDLGGPPPERVRRRE